MDQESKSLISNELKNIAPQEYFFSLFADKKNLYKTQTIMLLFQELNKIKNVSSEVMIQQIRLKWWQEHINDSSTPLLKAIVDCSFAENQISSLFEAFDEEFSHAEFENIHQVINMLANKYTKLFEILYQSPFLNDTSCFCKIRSRSCTSLYTSSISLLKHSSDLIWEMVLPFVSNEEAELLALYEFLQGLYFHQNFYTNLLTNDVLQFNEEPNTAHEKELVTLQNIASLYQSKLQAINRKKYKANTAPFNLKIKYLSYIHNLLKEKNLKKIDCYFHEIPISIKIKLFLYNISKVEV